MNWEKNIYIFIPEIKDTNNLLMLNIEVNDKLTIKEFLLYIRSKVIECYNRNIITPIKSEKCCYIISYDRLHKELNNLNNANYMHLRIVSNEGDNRAILHQYGTYFSDFIYSDFKNRYISFSISALNNLYSTLEQFNIYSENEIIDFRKRLIGKSENEYLSFDICEQIKRIAHRIPEKVALWIDGINYTYEELWRRIIEIASIINNRDDLEIIAVWGGYDFDMIASTFAILAVNKTYFPIDSGMPQQRIVKALKTLRCKAILGYKGQPFEGVETISLNSNMCDTVEFEYKKRNNSQAVAYVMFSSGTTGEPKAIPVKYISLANYIWWKKELYHYDESVVSLQVLSYNFDAFGANLYPVLLFGGKMVMQNRNEQKNFGGILELIKKEHINEFNVVPSYYMNLLSSSKGDELDEVKRVVLGGESAGFEVVRVSKEMYPSIELINEYGPTETTITITYNRDMCLNNINCIGTFINNNRGYIINEDEMILGPGVPGELCISGVSVMDGYLYEEACECFTSINGEKVYKTGDIVRYNKMGEIEYLGRKNNQVSINGFRVDLEEIEYYLTKSGLVSDSVVSIRKDRYNNKYLCAFVVKNNEKDINIDDIVNDMKACLPDYMIPKQYVCIKELPKNINGKIDRDVLSQLPIYERDILSKQTVLPQTATEEKLLAIWKELLGIKKISCIDNFFDIGGNSLLVMELQTKVEEQFEICIPVTDFFSFYTISELGKRIDLKKKSEGGAICGK